MTPLEQDVLLGLLDSFLDDSVILEVLEVVQGGKEATQEDPPAPVHPGILPNPVRLANPFPRT